MMKPANRYLSVCMLLLCQTATCDDFSVSSQTTSAMNARFEIVQFNKAAKFTFRLDRYTGRVWQMVVDENDNVLWQEMEVIDPPRNPKGNGHARFQIFISGIAARDTFLIDQETGNSWQIAKGTYKDDQGNDKDYSLWQPMSVQPMSVQPDSSPKCKTPFFGRCE